MVLNHTALRAISLRTLVLAILVGCCGHALAAWPRAVPPPGVSSRAPVVLTWSPGARPDGRARSVPAQGAGGTAKPWTGPSAIPFDPTCLSPDEDELALSYATALARARGGDLVGALDSMERLQTQCEDEDLGEHISRDIERIGAFLRQRTLHLEQMAATGGRLRLKLKGRDLEFNVERLEGDRVVFKNSLAGVSNVLVSELDSHQMAKQMSRDLEGKSGRWVRVYGYVLAGDERWSALIRRDCKGLAEAELLREDAESWYPSVMRLGQAGALIGMLATPNESPEGPSTEVTIERLTTLLGEYGDLDIVLDRRDDLRVLAESRLAASYRPDEALQELAGACERLASGAIRLSYDWDDPRELSDFESTPGYPAERIAALPQLLKGPSGATHEFSKGELVVKGSASWRHIMAFEGAITVRCRLRVGDGPKEGNPSCFWMLGACDDGQESYVALQELGTAMAVDRASGFVGYSSVEAVTNVGPDPLELELSCDGSGVRTKVNAELVKEVESGGRDRGRVFLVVHSDAPVFIEQLEIEGTCSEQSRYQSWLTKRLASIGFGAESGSEETHSGDGPSSSEG